MKICIPSSNRAERCDSAFISNAIIFVPKGQKKEYEKKYQNEIIECSVTGITATRNYILDYFKGEEIVMLDDDVLECGFFQGHERVNLKSAEHTHLWNKIFKDCFDVAKGFGFDIFGVDTSGSKIREFVFAPFKFNGGINGSCLGIIENGFRFDERLIVKEDFDFILKSYYRNKGFLKANFFYWRTKHWNNKGGCVDYRTNKIEHECIQLLLQRFPNNIKVGKGKNIFHTSLKF